MNAQESKIKDILKKKFFVKPTESMTTTPLLKLGLSELDINEFINHLEEEFQVAIDTAATTDHLSIHQLVNILETQKTS